MRLAALLVLAAACAHPAPVRVVTVRTELEPMRCPLPPLPTPAVVVGFPVGAPASLELAVTKGDAAELQRELAGLRAWAAAVAACVEPR